MRIGQHCGACDVRRTIEDHQVFVSIVGNLKRFGPKVTLLLIAVPGPQNHLEFRRGVSESQIAPPGIDCNHPPSLFCVLRDCKRGKPQKSWNDGQSDVRPES